MFRKENEQKTIWNHQLTGITQKRPAGYENHPASIGSLSGWWNRSFSGNYQEYRYPAVLRVVDSRIMAYQFFEPEGLMHLQYVGEISKLEDETLSVSWSELDMISLVLSGVTNQWSVDNQDYRLKEPKNGEMRFSTKNIQERLVVYANAKADELWISTREGKKPNFGDSNVYVKAKVAIAAGSR